MCDGRVESVSKAFGPPTSANIRNLSLLLFLTVVSTGQGSGCVRPYMVQNSWVNLTETNRGSFPVDTVLQYSCDPGYAADGPTTITCTPLGRWSSDPPHCVHSDVCPPPSQPENGGYTCHPTPCGRLPHGTVVEFFCDEGFILKGDYKYMNCQDGEWNGAVQISCLLDRDRDPALPLGMPTLSIVASTASSVALILLLVVLFVLLQPKLKSLHHSRREQGVSGQPVSIMVEGVQVALPSYEEAVCGGGGGVVPPSGPESRVQIVMSEPPPAEAGSPPYLAHHHSETAVVHPAPPPSSAASSASSPAPSSSSSSGWGLEQAAAPSPPATHRRLSSGSEQHSLPQLDSEMDYSDDMPLLKEA